MRWASRRLPHAVPLPVDDALSLAGAIERVTDRAAVDESTKAFKVQWFNDGVLLSYRIDGVGRLRPGVRLQIMAEGADGDWPKSYLIPSILLSLTAAGFLAWHVLDPARHVDGWAITLLVVGFLPWLRTVFESIDFPGGGSVTWRKAVEKEQKRQAQDIEAVLQFLTANFLSVPEREFLQRLASGVSLPFKGDGAWRNLHTRIHPLLDKGLIAQNPPITPDAEFATAQEAFRITDRGQQYLDLISKLPADSGHVPGS